MDKTGVPPQEAYNEATGQMGLKPNQIGAYAPYKKPVYVNDFSEAIKRRLTGDK